jgi:hypothetical protein
VGFAGAFFQPDFPVPCSWHPTWVRTGSNPSWMIAVYRGGSGVKYTQVGSRPRPLNASRRPGPKSTCAGASAISRPNATSTLGRRHSAQCLGATLEGRKELVGARECAILAGTAPRSEAAWAGMLLHGSAIRPWPSVSFGRDRPYDASLRWRPASLLPQSNYRGHPSPNPSLPSVRLQSNLSDSVRKPILIA